MKATSEKVEGGPSQAQGNKKKLVSEWMGFAGILVLSTALLVIFPSQRQPSLDAFREFLSEMVFIMPAVLVLMGLFSVWIPKETITRYLGHGSGLRGMVLALLFGTLPTGPLYAAFPLSKSLLDKDASPANVFIFMAAWACIKIPQEFVELQFLGWRFTLARLGITIVVVVGMSGLFQWFLGKNAKDGYADV